MSTQEAWAPVSFVDASPKSAPVSDEIVIGKDVLELLTGAMYSEPLMIYREYVQNAADAIDELLAGPHEPNQEAPRIDINIDVQGRNVRVRDTGTGIARDQFERRLTALGASVKRGQAKRGFRGVGRLSGLGYCRELVFRSRRSRADPVLELSWDGRRLRELLRDAHYRDDLKSLIKTITSVRAVSGGEHPARFFEVEMRGVVRIKNDALLNGEAIGSYLSEVAPIAFKSDFSYGAEVDRFLAQHGVRAPGSLHLHAGGGTRELFRPHSDEIQMSKLASHANELQQFVLDGLDEEVAAVGWVLHHDYLGSIPRETGAEGIRVRCGNIQIGSARLLDELFAETRFNSWCIGEIHVLTPKIVPNGRRDNFEATAAWQDLQGKLAAIAAQLTKRCRSRSVARNRLNDLRRDYQATMDLVDFVAFQSRYGICQHDTTSVVAKTVANFLKAASSAHVGEGVRQEAAALAAKLESRERRGLEARARKDPLDFLSPQKRTAYREVFAHMIRVAKKPRDCIQLIDTIVDSARKDGRKRTRSRSVSR